MDPRRLVRPGPLAAALTVFFLWVSSTSPRALTFAPRLVGLPLATARDLAFRSHLHLRVVARPAPLPPGTVLAQRPRARAPLPSGATLTVEVAASPLVAVPDVRGLPVDDARLELARAGLAVRAIVYRRGHPAEADRVLTTDPPPRTAVARATAVEIVAAAP